MKNLSHLLLALILLLLFVFPVLAAETIVGYLFEVRENTLVVRQKGGGKQSVTIDSNTSLRFSKKGFVVARLADVPKGARLYVTAEGGVAKMVTIEEVPK